MFGLTPFNTKSLVNTKNNTGYSNFYDMIDDFFNDGFYPARSLWNDTFKLDVKENDKDYEIEAELPGVKKEEIKLDYNEGRLLIGIEREEQVNEESNNYLHRERRLSSMQRGIYLKDAQVENIEAKLENGILKVIVPKLEKTDNRIRIEVK